MAAVQESGSETRGKGVNVFSFLPFPESLLLSTVQGMEMFSVSQHGFHCFLTSSSVSIQIQLEYDSLCSPLAQETCKGFL
jgi:hypothetical protein